MLCKCCSVGPDGIGNYRVRLYDFPHSIGIGALSSEATGDLNYLFRPAPHAPTWLSKHCYVGGVGWGIEHGLRLNARSLLSNTQIKVKYARNKIYSYKALTLEIPSINPI